MDIPTPEEVKLNPVLPEVPENIEKLMESLEIPWYIGQYKGEKITWSPSVLDHDKEGRAKIIMASSLSKVQAVLKSRGWLFTQTIKGLNTTQLHLEEDPDFTLQNNTDWPKPSKVRMLIVKILRILAGK